jgi:glycolate oxidase FAD binding subunit
MPHELDDLPRRLSGIMGGEQVREGTAASGFSVDGAEPSLVVHPGSQEEVEAVVVACGKAGAVVVPWGGGTAIGLGNPPSRLDVVVCLDRLARIVEFDEANLNVSAEAGVRLDDLQAVLAGKHEFLPLDPPQADRVTVGGLVAANSSGPSRLHYGTARDWVLGLRVVLPDGERIRCGGKVVKNVSGYDMNKLFIGSLGTLGIVTEATFKLLPVPAMRVTIVGLFRELAQAAAVVAGTLESQLLPEALEALDSQALGAAASALGLTDPSGYGLAIAVAGSRETVERQVRDFTRLFAQSQATATTTLGGAQGAAARRAIGDVQARMGVTSEERVVVKIAVPIGKTLELLSSAERLARRNGWRGAVTAHAGSGIVRAGYLVGGATLESLRDGLRALRGQAESAEGSLVVETAPAALKCSLDAWGKPPEAAEVMRQLKVEFDPRGLVSPGRFLAGI